MHTPVNVCISGLLKNDIAKLAKVHRRPAIMIWITFLEGLRNYFAGKKTKIMPDVETVGRD